MEMLQNSPGYQSDGDTDLEADPHQHEPYQCEPLPEGSNDSCQYIRVFELGPAGPGDKYSRGSLRIIALEAVEGMFEALSYTWGENKFTETLVVDGRTLRITKNLHACLLRLRGAEKRVLWIDAICINQGDMRERTAQVAVMGRIYSSARRTVSWLGEPPSNCNANAVFDFFRKVAPQISRIHAEWNNVDNLYFHRHVMAVATAQYGEGFDLVLRDWILRLLCANEDVPYFGRRWVIQEIFLAREVEMVWGEYSLDWKDFVTVVRGLTFEHSDIYTGGALEFLTRKTYSQEPWPGKSNILNIMDTFSRTECQEPIDRIAALQGLWRGDMATLSAFLVDYTQTVEMNYVQFATMLAQTAECGPLLMYAIRAQAYQNRSMPTWVPDWRKAFFPYAPGAEAMASLSFRAELGEPGSIVLRGWIIDTILSKIPSECAPTASGLTRRLRDLEGLHWPTRRFREPDDLVSPGDKICTFERGDMFDIAQFVLRPSARKPGYYTLQEICYWSYESQGHFEQDESWRWGSEPEEIILE